MKLSREEFVGGPLSAEERTVLERVNRSILSLTLDGAVERAERLRKQIIAQERRVPRCSEFQSNPGGCRPHHVRLETEDGYVVVRCKACGAHSSYAVVSNLKIFDYVEWE